MKKLFTFFICLAFLTGFAQDKISSTKDTVPVGGGVTMTTSVAISHHWNTGATTSVINANPTSSTTYYDTIRANGNTVVQDKTIYVDSNAFDFSAVIYFDSCSNSGYPISAPYKIKYNNYVVYLKNSNQWNNSDSRFVWATGNENWAKRDIRNPARTITLHNTYAGRFSPDTGYNGNGSFAIITNYNPGDGGTYNFVQNSATVGCLLAYNTSISPAQELTATNSTGTNGIVISAFANGVGYVNSNFSLSGATYQKYRFNSRGWFQSTRTASTNEHIYWNGVKTCTQVISSNAVLNRSIAILGSYKGTFAAGLYSSNTHSVFYAGDGTLNPKVESDAFNYAFSGTVSNFTSRVTFEGDSRTGSVGASSASVQSAYPKAVMSALGNGWCSALVSESGEKLQQITTQYSTEIQPYRDTTLTHDIIIVWAGTNDFASNRTATQVYTDLVSFCTQAKNDGFKVVVVGDIARSTYTGTQQTHSTNYTNSLLTDFSTTVTTNIYSGATYADYYINLIGDTVFQNAANTIYYQVDGIHLNGTGCSFVAPYVTTVIQLY